MTSTAPFSPFFNLLNSLRGNMIIHTLLYSRLWRKSQKSRGETKHLPLTVEESSRTVVDPVQGSALRVTVRAPAPGGEEKQMRRNNAVQEGSD